MRSVRNWTPRREVTSRIYVRVNQYLERGANLESAFNLTAWDYSVDRHKVEKLFHDESERRIDDALDEIIERRAQEVS